MAPTALRCRAKTKDGQRCHNNAIDGSKYCYIKSHGGTKATAHQRISNFIHNNLLITVMVLVATFLGLSIGLLQLKYYHNDKSRERAVALEREQHPILVSPGDIDLNSCIANDSRKTNSQVKVYNHTDDPYYQIWVKILIDSPVVTSKQILLNLPVPPPDTFEWAGNDPPFVSTKVMCYRGLDKNRQPAFLCFVRDLNPRETVTLTLLNNYPEKLPESHAHKALVSIVGFNREPARIVEGAGEGAVNHPWPEAFTIEEVIIRSKGPVDLSIIK